MLKSKFEKILNKIFHHRNEELPSFLLSKLFHSGKYLPFTSSSLKMKPLACVINNIVVHNRKSILEMGSGISTIIIARLFKLNEINGHILSIDENYEWQKIISNFIKEEKLEQYVTFINAPVEKTKNLENSYGYNKVVVKNALQEKYFDLILIDGPSAWSSSNIMSRASNFELFENNLQENFTIFIDNADRSGEKKLGKYITSKFGITPTKLDVTFVSYKKGKHFNFAI